jgi:hypothetical protein
VMWLIIGAVAWDLFKALMSVEACYIFGPF